MENPQLKQYFMWYRIGNVDYSDYIPGYSIEDVKDHIQQYGHMIPDFRLISVEKPEDVESHILRDEITGTQYFLYQ